MELEMSKIIMFMHLIDFGMINACILYILIGVRAWSNATDAAAADFAAPMLLLC